MSHALSACADARIPPARGATERTSRRARTDPDWFMRIGCKCEGNDREQVAGRRPVGGEGPRPARWRSYAPAGADPLDIDHRPPSTLFSLVRHDNVDATEPQRQGNMFGLEMYVAPDGSRASER
jgi:hypothetical protein